MSKINDILARLEFAQIGWVVPDIHATRRFLEKSLGVNFPEPHRYSAAALGIRHHGEVVPSEGLTTQTFNGGCFIELIQPLTGRSMFHDYLTSNPHGGVQHLAFRLAVEQFDQVVDTMVLEGYPILAEVDHPIARMKFFDTYAVTGVVTEIMGITPEGYGILDSMKATLAKV